MSDAADGRDLRSVRCSEVADRAALAGARIVERSWLAWIAARRLRVKRAAIVIGRTIHLSGATRTEFLTHDAWVRHELAHVRQFERHGRAVFMALYLLESLRRGYRHNRYEVEARAAETRDEVT